MRWLFLAFTAVALSGCGLPPALTVASLVADFASYASTGKSVTDHGISLVLEQDCAMLRGLGGEICVEADPLQVAADRKARDLEYVYPEEIGSHVIARAPADPATEFGSALAFATDPEVTPRASGQMAWKLLEEVSYLRDARDPEG